jgi:diguanylate cyclase (GGDEF)-like protein
MSELNRKELLKLRGEIDSVQGRFFGLLSITVGMMLVLACGFVLRVFPHVLGNVENLTSERFYLPQLLFGLLVLVALLSWYVLQQRQRLRATQQTLVKELVRRETAERLAVVDPLTEVYNRRHMRRAIAGEVARASRQNSKFAFLMIDVNDFKRANDSLGHLKGDHILRALALLLHGTLRTSDIISRYGGDEFLVLLVDSDDAQADKAIRRVQDAVNQWNCRNEIAGYKMSISCGSAVYSPGADVADVLAAADRAMYQNKDSQPVSLPKTAGHRSAEANLETVG